ncbi:hypothetical protein B0H66DRAFT_385022 [Apodospora peruviana]|uniref:Circumsporozoite protein n=1 Tax=Apodospora peruviana TaxID=516989 RepID=A0AAE0HUD1_9PEZI|nr:hypothetical protein B0H66DRAFT_385022 [Apodospora peruviana]
MQSKVAIVAALLAAVEARFGREQEAQGAIGALSAFGNPGAAATLAGASISTLLGGANACDKLAFADKIVAELGNDPEVIAAAAGLVAAEKNFNNFAQDIPTICSDATLPATAELRGIVPLVDPGVLGSDVENANSASSLTNPFNADGLSVAEVMIANGFSNFTLQGSDGSTAAAGGAAAGGAAGNAGNAGNAAEADKAANTGAVQCGGVVTTTVAAAPAATSAAAVDNNNNDNANDNAGNANAGAADFGLCDPRMDFQLGRPGRKADEGTFLPVDELVAKGQQDALNPNIITNRICDQLTNVCEANQAAKDVCEAAKAVVQGLATKDATTADAFNQALGF